MFIGALPLLWHELVKQQMSSLGLQTNIYPLSIWVKNMLKSWALICLPAQNVVWPLCQHCLSLAARRVSRNAFPSASDHADGPSIPVPYVAVDIKLFLRPLLLLKPTIRASPYSHCEEMVSLGTHLWHTYCTQNANSAAEWIQGRA